MTMIEKVTRAMYTQYEWGVVNGFKDAMHNAAKTAINALRNPDEIDPKILIAMDQHGPMNYDKMWDAALDQIVDPD